MHDVKIINLSKRQLNTAEKSLLNKGLKFTLTPPIENPEQLTEDLKEFNRKMLLVEYFDGTEDTDESLVRNKSNFIPSPERINALDKFISTIEEFPKTKPNAISKPNIIKSESNAIKSLQNDHSIIIKEADKGGATVIMDREHYKEMVENTLNDRGYYEVLETNPHKETKLKYNKFLKKNESKLTKKELDYLELFEVKESQFYGLPKIHKSKEITNQCKKTNAPYVEVKEVRDLKLRPIGAGPSCLTHRVSYLLDIILRPFTNHVKSYLRDTTDFLINLPYRVPTNTSLASFDIEALYSNIPHELGIKAVHFWLDK